MKDLYKTLNLTSNCTQEQIKVSFRTLSKQLHPDLHPGDVSYEEQFKEIQEAYYILKNPQTRKEYDQRFEKFKAEQQLLNRIHREVRVHLRRRRTKSGRHKTIRRPFSTSRRLRAYILPLITLSAVLFAFLVHSLENHFSKGKRYEKDFEENVESLSSTPAVLASEKIQLTSMGSEDRKPAKIKNTAIATSFKPITQESEVDFQNFEKYYRKFNVTGSFTLYNLNTESFAFYNEEASKKSVTPASTFKILNSLIALETGAIANEMEIIKWDSVDRGWSEWNKDQNMGSAFQKSAVWFYQELARRIGETKMKTWISKVNYGNQNISGGIDQFWLDGSLKISPLQQVNFLKKLYKNELPFSRETMQTVKKLMIIKDTDEYRLSGKTGWGKMRNRDIGWFVGFLETKKGTYLFANCIENKGNSTEDFAKSRIEITEAIFKELSLTDG